MIGKNEYSEVFRAMPTPCMMLLPNKPVFTIMDVSDAYLALTATTREQLIARNFFDVFPDNPYHHDPAWESTFDKVLREKKPHRERTQKYSLPSAGNSPYTDLKYMETVNTPVLNDQGEITMIIRSIMDVTDAVYHENFLEETQQVARMGSWQVDIPQQTVTWSAGMRKVLEVAPDYDPDFDSTAAFFPGEEDWEEIKQAIQQAERDGGIFRLTLPSVTAKGNERWLLIVGKADVVDGTCVRIYGVSQDITEKRNTEKALALLQRDLQNLVQTVDGIVWEADAETLQAKFVSHKIEEMLGYTAEEWLADPGFWPKHIYEADRERAVSYCHQETQKLANHTFDYRMVRKNGDIIWIRDIVSVIAESGKPRWLRGVMVDITETKLLSGLDHLEKTILELNAQDETPLRLILSDYLSGIEALFPGLYCSIHRVQDNHLLSWAAPSLPENYLKAIHNLAIGENSGSCGSAAYVKKPVIVSDIANDPKWAAYKHLALDVGLKACWSYPITDSAGNVIAVLGMYYNEVKTPSQKELTVIDRTTVLLKIILENHQHADLAKQAAAMMAQGQALARFGNWQWDIATNKVTWSPVLYDIYGLDTSLKLSFESYLAQVHDDDKAYVIAALQQVRQTGNDTTFEERILRPDGSIRHLRSWARLVVDDSGAPSKMTGACLDITEAKLAELELKSLHERLALHLQEVEESERRYSDLFHLSPLPKWVYDMETYRFLDVNAAAIEHYGYTREEFLSMTIMDIRPVSEIPKVEAAVAFSMQHDTLFTKAVYIHQKKNGEIIEVEIQSNIIDFHGRRAEVVLAHDITDKLYYINAIETQNTKLQEIAWMQSHLVRAPLARIMGLVDLIRYVPESGIGNSELLGAINDSAIELDHVLSSITDKAEQINVAKHSKN